MLLQLAWGGEEGCYLLYKARIAGNTELTSTTVNFLTMGNPHSTRSPTTHDALLTTLAGHTPINKT